MNTLPKTRFPLRLTSLAWLLSVWCTMTVIAADIPVKLERFDGPNPSFVAAPGGVIEIHGANKLLVTPMTPIRDGNWVLEWEYFCLGGVAPVTLTPGPPFEPKAARQLPPLGNSETWSVYAAPLQSLASAANAFRVDLPLKSDGVLQIRNARLRPERPGEFEVKANTSTNAATAPALEAYLNHAFRSEITSVKVGTAEITISGNIAGDRDALFLGDIPMERLVSGVKLYESLTPVTPDAKGTYVVKIPRLAPQQGRICDRLTSRWQVVHRTATGYEAMTHARYADEVVCRSPYPPAAKPKSKKGLGGWTPGRTRELSEDLEQLGIAAVTVNLFSLQQFVALNPEPDTTPFAWQGRTYYAREKRLARYDQTFCEAEKHGVMVSAILLITNPAGSADPAVKLLGHPDAVKEGKYAMPNVTSAEGIAYYGAILNLLAERWSKNDGVHGRVHHWIMHNEVDFGWVWTNAGVKADLAYMDLYQRSVRLMDLIARQYDPNARAFISLTHHWAQAGDKTGYGSKRLIELLLRFCRAEGDFPWALAYHPYPQSLRNPRTWEDQQATFDFNTAKITPNNLEVLDAFMKLPALRYHGAVRPVHLSENGFNSKDYSPKALEDQAAGMALAWKKMAKLSSIESWQYHNWIDNRSEGGLRIGLRRFGDDAEAPYGKKPIWHLYQALGTPQEDAVAAPFLKTIGISSWDEVIHHQAIR